MRLRLLFSFLLVCLAGPAFSQVLINGKSYTVDECLAMAKEAEEKGHYREATNYLNQTAFYVWDQKMFDEGISYFMKSIELNEKIKNSSGIATINSNLGMLYHDKGDYNEALAYFSKALEARKKMRETYAVVSTMINMSYSLNKLKRYDDAIALIEEALPIAGEIDDRDQLLAAYGLLFETYELKGDAKKSMEYFEIYRSIHNAISLEEEVKAEVEIQQSQYEARLAEVAKKNKELELALKEKELEKTQQELGAVDSTNKELLEQFSKYELLVSNLEQQEQIKALEQEHLQSQLDREREVRIYFIIGLILAGAILIVVFFFYRHNLRMNRLLRVRNEQVEAQAQKLKDENIIRTKLLSVISHDLRSPLSSVHLMVQLLKTNAFSPEQASIYLTNLDDSLRNTFALLDNILYWAKSQLNGIKATPEVFNISHILDENTLLIESGLKTKNIRLVNNVGEVEVYADREITKMVLRNILSNALKFTPVDGKITVSVEPQGKDLVVSIADTGIGIPPEKQDKIFTSNITSTSGTKNEPSSGMGLMLSRDFIKRTGGKIWFESEVGKGTTFYITLPLSKEE
ncbi:MAG: tetratricopeptide repeat protein [Prevotellaceae bacterium]|jgi:signal transduction histidine kinase|nr:tetratricopeptide repeat protein [Prevotellaceae bacterium]